MNSYSKGPKTEIDVANNLALIVETAAENFETLKMLVANELFVQASRPEFAFAQMRASACIQMALAKAFLFNARRVHRILEHGASNISIPRERRREFLRALEPIIDVRDVNEHGFDVHKRSAKNKSRPKMHFVENGQMALDDTSLIIMGTQKIFMGPLNLFEVFEVIKQIRDIAGFSALRSRDPNLSSSTDQTAI